jgi:hypothetical protein
MRTITHAVSNNCDVFLTRDEKTKFGGHGKQNFKAGLALLLQGIRPIEKPQKEATMTDAERREKARLRSERWRRAHGIGPRRPAQRPWLAEGISRSTWYRRKQRARQAAVVAYACATFERAEAFAAALARDLDRCATLERETVAILAELTALTVGGSGQAMV